MIVLFDINVILDVLLQRSPWAVDAAAAWDAHTANRLKAHVAAFSVPTIFYMEKVFPIREEKREIIPAVTHVDGSGRLQTVSKRTNPLYHALISRFYEKTGVPIVLNTSLNENEPVVRTPAEAIACILRTSMDVLVVGDCLIDRHRADFPNALRVPNSKP